jgi:hypothetical protein
VQIEVFDDILHWVGTLRTGDPEFAAQQKT